jgi:DNA-binding MarR family transcriptional regulator
LTTISHTSEQDDKADKADKDDKADKADKMVDAVLSASRVLVAVAARSLADLDEEVTLTQYRSLVVLASRGTQAMAALADALGISPPTASRLCDRLVRKGLVRRRTDRNDRRQVRVGLTDAGRRLVDVVSERRRNEIAALLRSVPDDARRSVVAGLQLLADAAGEVPEQDWSAGWDL